MLRDVKIWAHHITVSSTSLTEMDRVSLERIGAVRHVRVHVIFQLDTSVHPSFWLLWIGYKGVTGISESL